ncbi:sugar ABC transporter ATP-binding protein, partial [Mycobacterium tuberculosis]|nr:sugar ABC transporter ATP-binding protein [Mycobacterium tuberculosis]
MLTVTRLTVPGWVRDASFALRAGEILGFAGLIGAGRTELMEGIMGLRRRAGGSVAVAGRPIGSTA